MISKRKKGGGAIILGAGITGLSAGYASGLPVYEGTDIPGGICTSYYIKPNKPGRLYAAPKDGNAYHFEIGGGHWVFGGDPAIIRFMKKLAPFKRYVREASIYLPERKTFVPYPIQNNLHALDAPTARQAMDEIIHVKVTSYKVKTMADWMKASFGKTLCDIFFFPFHDLYTAGLHRRIMPQDGHKSPINKEEVRKGALGKAASAGYNTTFIYPEKGLDFLTHNLEKACDVRYGKRVTKIDIRKQIVYFKDKTHIPYSEIISTLPLNRMAEVTGIDTELGEKPHPSPAVLVVNIGAVKGPDCPKKDHWIYIPASRTRFHRVGFYSNVDSSFLPRSHRSKNDRVSIYVEKAYPEGTELSQKEMDRVSAEITHELQEWGWIGKVEACDPTWIQTAYTWSWPDSKWKEKALRKLEEHGIYQIGRYGRWVFQGIADSIKDGLMIGGAFSDKKIGEGL